MSLHKWNGQDLGVDLTPKQIGHDGERKEQSHNNCKVLSLEACKNELFNSVQEIQKEKQ